MIIVRRLPEPIKRVFRPIRDYLRYLPYSGNSRYCPICGKSSRVFGKFGVVPRDDAQCMYCRLMERHRLVWLYFNRMTDLFDGRLKRMLHVAPEPAIEKSLRKRLGTRLYYG